MNQSIILMMQNINYIKRSSSGILNDNTSYNGQDENYCNMKSIDHQSIANGIKQNESLASPSEDPDVKKRRCISCFLIH